MPTFLLRPVADLAWHADWMTSAYDGDCIVIANDEAHARRLAAEKFRSPLPPCGAAVAWTRADLVTAAAYAWRDGVGLPVGTVVEVVPVRGVVW